MTPELKKEWIEALRSGDYNQGRYILYNERENKHCCLGVLSCILQKENRKQYLEYPPEEILSSPDQGYFMILNDVEKLSFNEIANKLEEEMEEE